MSDRLGRSGRAHRWRRAPQPFTRLCAIRPLLHPLHRRRAPAPLLNLSSLSHTQTFQNILTGQRCTGTAMYLHNYGGWNGSRYGRRKGS